MPTGLTPVPLVCLRGWYLAPSGRESPSILTTGQTAVGVDTIDGSRVSDVFWGERGEGTVDEDRDGGRPILEVLP